MKQLTGLFILLIILASCKKENTDTESKQKIISDSLGVIRVSIEKELGKTIPSLSVLIQTPDETLFATDSHEGEIDITPDTYFRFASNSKNFTSTAILNMYEDGWLDIYSNIIDTIPGSNITYVPSGMSWEIPYKDKITIEQLLQHSAGVYDVDNDPVPNCNGRSFTEYTMENNPNYQFTIDELVNQLTKYNLYYWEPGYSFHYSNTGYSILSEIIARVYSEHAGSPKNFKDYLYDYIYGPNTTVPINIEFPYLANDQDMPTPHAIGTIYYPADLGGDTKYDASNMSAHVAEGNGYGTFNQLNKYVRSLMTGNNVLSPESITLMQTDFAPDTSGKSEYALGCRFKQNIGFGHNGLIRGYLSIMAYDPDHKVSIVVMMNAVDYRTDNGFAESFKGMYKGAWKVREMMGYPGNPN